MPNSIISISNMFSSLKTVHAVIQGEWGGGNTNMNKTYNEY